MQTNDLKRLQISDEDKYGQFSEKDTKLIYKQILQTDVTRDVVSCGQENGIFGQQNRLISL